MQDFITPFYWKNPAKFTNTTIIDRALTKKSELSRCGGRFFKGMEAGTVLPCNIKCSAMSAFLIIVHDDIFRQIFISLTKSPAQK